MRYRGITLDLEGTLLTNGVSRLARPFLWPFLDFVRAQFGHNVAIFSALGEPHRTDTIATLVNYKEAPAWLAELRHVDWSLKGYKHSRFAAACLELPEDSILHVDDCAAYCTDLDAKNWIFVPAFDYSDPAEYLDTPVLQIVCDEILKRQL